MIRKPLSAPFPYFGGKSRVAGEVWKRFGRSDVYAEPFAGSLAVLLANPHPARREIVCDTDGLICNFWRAVQADPEDVARHADYPTIHQDLTARHRFLVRWALDNSARLSEDPRYYDAEAAGWWVWGISIWVGAGWCTSGTAQSTRRIKEQRPYVSTSAGGRGVSAQRSTTPDKRPRTGSGARVSSGAGISAQREEFYVSDKRPLIGSGSGAGGGGVGVSRQRQAPREDIVRWFSALRDRLQRVVVLNRDWTSAVTPTVLADTETGPGERANRCIFLDPPYRTERRHAFLYQSDEDGSSDNVAERSFRWAVEHGEQYRIAYCAHVGDFDVPEGWESVVSGFGGRKRDREESRDLVMFSPACASGRSKGLLF